MTYDELLDKYNKLLKVNECLRIEIQELKGTVEIPVASTHDNTIDVSKCDVLIDKNSEINQKLGLFLSLFKGRHNVVAKRWEGKNGKSGYSPYCRNDFQRGVCFKPQVKCKVCKAKNFYSLDAKTIELHLRGKAVIGLYPMMEDDMCHLLAMDFDKQNWKNEVLTVAETCDDLHISTVIERSRSGNGAHIWFFFKESVKAATARKFGFAILDKSMQNNDNISLDSYDRLFPSQDFVQKEGFGNLIVLPLQKNSRAEGNSLFVDRDFKAYDDQWAFLSTVKQLNRTDLYRVIDLYEINSDSEQMSKVSVVSASDFKEPMILELSNGITLSKKQLSPKSIFLIRKLASYSNPEFYSKQAMRMSTYDISRVVNNCIEDKTFITIPRGLLPNLIELFNSYDITYDFIDQRRTGAPIKVSFKGQLRIPQQIAYDMLSSHDIGVLSATTGFGKTVIGSKLIADKKVPTLILVHTKELAIQWRERLETFLDIEVNIIETEIKKGRRKKIRTIGQLGGGKNTLTGIVDIALMQSMVSKDKTVKEIIHNYGMVIVDECHHVPSVSFSRVLYESTAKYVYGLTATPIRKDGHHPIIFMQCGQVRYKVDAKAEAKNRSFEHYITPRFTTLQMPVGVKESDWHISDLYRHVCENDNRNQLIVNDIKQAIKLNRTPIVLSERTTHLDLLEELLKSKNYKVIKLTGQLKAKERRVALEFIKNVTEEKFVLLATGRLIGEGFDFAKLDTLFLAMPIAWKGTVAQYAGRLHREYEGKKEVLVYDYVDVHIPRLERMYYKRLNAYKSIGYSLKPSEINDKKEGIFDVSEYLIPLEDDINDASKSIVIVSPKLDFIRFNQFKNVFAEKFKAGVKITVVTAKNLGKNHVRTHQLNQIMTELNSIGIKTVIRDNLKHKYVIVDGNILWYGSIDAFGYHNDDDSIIRMCSDTFEDIFLGAIQ